MSSRTISAGHVLPQNPTFIDFPVSDGHESQWPANTTRVVDSEGHVNYMRPVPIDESLSIKWRCEVGASLALQLKKPGIFPALSLAGRLLTRFVVCASRQLAQPMSFVAGQLVIRCLIIIKGLQAHHDMMPTLSVRLFVCYCIFLTRPLQRRLTSRQTVPLGSGIHTSCPLATHRPESRSFQLQLQILQQKTTARNHRIHGSPSQPINPAIRTCNTTWNQWEGSCSRICYRCCPVRVCVCTNSPNS